MVRMSPQDIIACVLMSTLHLVPSSAVFWLFSYTHFFHSLCSHQICVQMYQHLLPGERL